MEALLELLNAVRIGLTERITSPLLGNFIISWCLWNYRLFVTIFSDGYWEDKYNYIDKTLYPNAVSYWAAGLVPLVASLVLIYGYPLVARYVYEHRLEVNKDLMEIRHRVEDSEPMNMEQARRLRENIREEQKKWQARIAEVEQENDDLKRDLESVRFKNESIASPHVRTNIGAISGTTKTIAAKLGATTGKELIVAAAAQLTFVAQKHTFTRNEILESMKSATGYFKITYSNNLTKYLNGLVDEQKLIETAANEFALKEDYRNELEALITAERRPIAVA